MKTTYQALAETTVLTVYGGITTFEQLADQPYSSETICAFRNGQMGSANITDPTFNMEQESATVVHMTLTTGEKFTLLNGSKLLLTDGTWVATNEIRVGDALKMYAYKRTQQHPQVTVKVVAHVTAEYLTFAPMVQYEADCSRFLLAVEQNDHDDLLLPCKSIEVGVFA